MNTGTDLGALDGSQAPSATLTLPAKLDLAAYEGVLQGLTTAAPNIAIDASAVESVGTLCLQALMAAYQSHPDSFSITASSDAFAAQTAFLGAPFAQIIPQGGAL